MVVEGEFHLNEQYSVYHFFKAGFFLVFDKSLDKPRLYSTIDQTDFPRATQTPNEYGGFSYGTYPEYFVFPSGTISDDKLYLLSNLQKNNKRAIDIYSLKSGDYIGSIDVNNLADGQKPEILAISKNDQNLFIQYEDLVIGKYEIRSTESP